MGYDLKSVGWRNKGGMGVEKKNGLDDVETRFETRKTYSSKDQKQKITNYSYIP